MSTHQISAAEVMKLVFSRLTGMHGRSVLRFVMKDRLKHLGPNGQAYGVWDYLITYWGSKPIRLLYDDFCSKSAAIDWSARDRFGTQNSGTYLAQRAGLKDVKPDYA